MTASAHSPGHDPAGDALMGAGTLGEVAVVVLWVLLAALYLVAGRRAALRGRADLPPARTASWLAGTGLGLVVTAGPLAQEASTSFTAHTAVHIALGMVVPVLLILGAPVTLVLRSVPARTGRRISAFARSAPVRALTHPVIAGLLATAPMAALYWSGSPLQLLHDPVLGPLLHLHFVASGALFAYAVVGPDPNPHRAGPWLRGVVIVAAIAVHGVVAKHLYAIADRPGMPADTEQAAQLMYYGGDAAHVMLLVIFCAREYRRTGRRADPQPAGRYRVDNGTAHHASRGGPDELGSAAGGS